MKLLEVKNLSVSLGGKSIVEGISFDLEPGRWTMLIGPNGAGKSTLLRAVSQEIPSSGEILLDGRSVRSYRPAALARKMGMLSQHHGVSYSFTVGELVRLGRYAYAPGIFSRRGEEDEASVHRAMELTGIRELEHQSLLTLSGGELQRAFLAQVFAQNPQILLLDEPSNHLDLIYQKQIFELIGAWLQSSGGAVLSVVHDLSLARCYGSHALLLDQGKAMACGEISRVFRPEVLDPAYRMEVAPWMRRLYGQWEAGGTDGCSRPENL